jgi:hypothetical protein
MFQHMDPTKQRVSPLVIIRELVILVVRLLSLGTRGIGAVVSR